MATLAELRAAVRRQTETTAAELPNVTVDGFLKDAFNRTVLVHRDWPSYETQWQLNLVAGETTLAMPTNLDDNGIVSLVRDGDENSRTYRLTMVDHEVAEDVYYPLQAAAIDWAEFSVWGRYIFLWPVIARDVDTAFTLRGHRRPGSFPTSDSESPDCDERMHGCLVWYAVALAYAQQEDEVLEATYMARWQRDAEVARRNIMTPAHHRPYRMGGGLRDWRGV